jgi:hypothetical protein
VTATDRDVHEELGEEGEVTVHCAVHSPGAEPDAGVNARPRGRPREGSPKSAQSQDESAPGVDLDGDPALVTWSERLAGIAGVFTPPDIVSEDRPSLKKVWAHAARGEWTRKTGLPRRVGQIDALFISVPFVALFYLCAWTVERPSRRIAAAVLLVLLFQVPPLAWLI